MRAAEADVYLAVSKLVAGRERDMTFVAVLVREHMVDSAVLFERAAALALPDADGEALRQRLAIVTPRA